MPSFREALATQRWDDHRYYHHCRINQSLHLFSAISFLVAYATCVVSPALAALIGWLLAMVSRQAGHFFFEPKGYDAVNGVTHEHKEAIKVGYNLRRKIVLLAVWAAAPVALWLDPTLFGTLRAYGGAADFLTRLGELWLAVGIGGLLFRTVQLAVIKDVQTGLVWLTKILTDPFHDLQLYYKAPLHLLRGERLDPMPAERRA
ncbi:MAG: hypothetical protein KGL36_05220 [Gammaproteobacteria bacterium]|nr:hypothetical protein [Gammaproteobacteria bacterium]